MFKQISKSLSASSYKKQEVYPNEMNKLDTDKDVNWLKFFTIMLRCNFAIRLNDVTEMLMMSLVPMVLSSLKIYKQIITKSGTSFISLDYCSDDLMALLKDNDELVKITGST